MCGIAGLAEFHGPVQEEGLMSMLPGIRHRGPDGTGLFIHEHFGLLHARLSIIDVSSAANQPLFNEDKTLAVICNGEIYNHLILRKELEAKGHAFSCFSDTEVLLHLYEEHHDQPEVMLNKLKGMFAFALVDVKRKEMFLARDRFGIKPLYYTKDRKGFGFSSEINSLLSFRPSMAQQIDFTSLYEYFQFLSIPEPNTIYADVKSLPAGSFALVRNGEVKVKSWYALEHVVGSRYGDAQSFSKDLYDKLEQVVKEHLISDVPIGSFLSAGIDSTIVTHFASKHCNSSFTTISAGFPGYQEDESEIALRTAQTLKLKNKRFVLEQQGFFDDAGEIVRYLDQPFAVSSAFSLYRISKLARKEMKVVLSGDGGDEVFAGYDYKYKPFYVPSIVRHTPARLHPLMSRVLGLLPIQKTSALAQQYRLPISQRFLDRCRVLGESDSMAFIPLEKRKDVDQDRFPKQVRELFERAAGFSTLHQLLFADMGTFLKSEMLYKVDRMTMANALEGRVPFLDHELVEMAFRAQPSFLRDDVKGKLPFRDLVDRYYPGLGSRSKTGFNTPLDQLLKQSESTRKRVVELASSLTNSELIEQDTLREFVSGVEQNNASANRTMLVACLGGWLKGKEV